MTCGGPARRTTRRKPIAERNSLRRSRFRRDTAESQLCTVGHGRPDMSARPSPLTHAHLGMSGRNSDEFGIASGR